MYKFQITILAQQVGSSIANPKEFVEVYRDNSIEERLGIEETVRLCALYLYNLYLSHPYRWSPNPYVGYVQIIDFESWLRHEEIKSVEIKGYK